MSLPERFWSKVDKTPTCWNWTGACNSKGYGQFRLKKMVQAHRISYENTYGPLKNQCCHKCDNPKCVRPDHLFDGTNSDNQRDSGRKGRSWKKLTDSDVLNIFQSKDKQSDLAKRYGVNQDQISRIKSGKRWAWLTAGLSKSNTAEYAVYGR